MKLSKIEIIVVIVLILTAGVRFYFFKSPAPNYDNAVNKQVQLTGIVTDNPDVRLTGKRLTITPLGEQSNIIAVVSLSEEVSYGDEVRVEGKLETPANFMTNAGKEFNYIQYLNNQDVYYIINDASITVLSHNHGPALERILFNIKNKFMASVSRGIPSPEGDLAN